METLTTKQKIGWVVMLLFFIICYAYVGHNDLTTLQAGI